MENQDQNQQAPMSPESMPGMASISEQNAPVMHTHKTLIALVLLVVVAIVLFSIARTVSVQDQGIAENADQTYQYSEVIPEAGDTPEATNAEADAIRADLEASSADGVSDGL